MSAPSVIVLGGPNGSGKSTAAVRLLRDELKVLEFVNADQIAQGLSAFRPEGHALEAGRVMLNQLKRLAESNECFAFESTLASRSFATWLQDLQTTRGYEIRLVYVWLQSVEINIERIATRFALGGHSIPEETIRRRYHRSIQNFFDLYLPLANRWEVYDNSEQTEPRLIASGIKGGDAVVLEQRLWEQLRSYHDSE